MTEFVLVHDTTQSPVGRERPRTNCAAEIAATARMSPAPDVSVSQPGLLAGILASFRNEHE